MKHFKMYYIGIILLFASCAQEQSAIQFSEPDYTNLAPTSDYVIYSDCATLPTLHIGLHMLTHDKPSYFFMGREGTLNETKIPKHITLVKSRNKLREIVREINEKNPNATFSLYANDLRVAMMFSFFYSQGIDSNRVKVVSIADGISTYKGFTLFYNRYLASFLWNLGKRVYLTQSKKNPKKNLGFDYFHNLGVFLIIPSMSENASIWLQWPELMLTKSAKLAEYLKTRSSRYYKMDPQKYFQSLTPSQQKQFIDMVGLDKKWAMDEGGGTLNNQTIEEALDASPKPNIIITGTTPYRPKNKDTDLLISKVKELYGDDYDYFFKGHPRDFTKPQDTSITVLPFRLPMEAILWAYGDKIETMGGYDSSLYMSAPKEMKKFFFKSKKNGSSLRPPLNTMYKRDLLGEVTFIN